MRSKGDSGDKKEQRRSLLEQVHRPHADILKVAKKELKKEGYELELKNTLITYSQIQHSNLEI